MQIRFRAPLNLSERNLICGVVNVDLPSSNNGEYAIVRDYQFQQGTVIRARIIVNRRTRKCWSKQSRWDEHTAQDHSFSYVPIRLTPILSPIQGSIVLPVMVRLRMYCRRESTSFRRKSHRPGSLIVRSISCSEAPKPSKFRLTSMNEKEPDKWASSTLNFIA